MFPAYRQAQSNFVYFCVFISATSFFILPMILTMMMDAFWSMTKKLVKKERKKERKKLIEAFNFLDVHGDGVIEKETWLGLMKVCYNGLITIRTFSRHASKLTSPSICSCIYIKAWVYNVRHIYIDSNLRHRNL